ncbi:hypothetical protein DRW07_05740 [Alteromonas sediminis]|uniref:Sulfotransferase family protein n=1 Tax=Alteromonas sediminis TaxID=2259342 RepID=A0A3N5Y2X7_9ALTE|nr:hypothetical protein [Alteromonas sediminis]RPJ67046.1 hypothetical protein DRW07_05740 [Alteromonas sediminis]
MPINRDNIKFVFHIGTGKTGTSSIQQYLSTLPEATSKFFYTGYLFERLKTKRYAWQRVTGTPEFNQIPKEQLSAELELVFSDAIDEAMSRGADTIIWSNEALCNMCWLPDLIKQVWTGDITTLCFVREPASYSVSAYFQWGIKHKIYAGEVPAYADFIRRHHFVHADIIESWKAISSTFFILNYDKTDNVVETFCHKLGVPVRGAASNKRINTRHNVTQLYASALANSSDEAPCLYELPSEWEQMDNRDLDWFSEKLPTVEQISEHLNNSQRETDKLNALLLCCEGETSLLETGDTSTLLVDKSSLVNAQKVLAQHTSSLVIKQHKEIQQLMRRVGQQAQQISDLAQELKNVNQRHAHALSECKEQLEKMKSQSLSVRTVYKNLQARFSRFARLY